MSYVIAFVSIFLAALVLSVFGELVRVTFFVCRVLKQYEELSNKCEGLKGDEMRAQKHYDEQLQFVPRWQYGRDPTGGASDAMDLVRNDLIDTLHIDEQIVPLLKKKSLAETGK